MIRVLRIAIPSAIVGAYLYAGWVVHELDKLTTGTVPIAWDTLERLAAEIGWHRDTNGAYTPDPN
jgi:hypothetical protein